MSNVSDPIKHFKLGIKPEIHHLKCIEERQTGSRMKKSIAVSLGHCKYGFPQAVVRRPVDMENGVTQSGMVRLTCPHLVREIDEYEAAGGVSIFNKEFAIKDDVSANFRVVNQDWQIIRNEYSTPEEKTHVKEKLGDRAINFFDSGIIGVPLERYFVFAQHFILHL